MKRTVAVFAVVAVAMVTLLGCQSKTILPGPTPRPAGVIVGKVTWYDGSDPGCEVEWVGTASSFTYISRCFNLSARSQIMRVKCPDDSILTGVWRRDGRGSLPPKCPTGVPTWWQVEVTPLP